MNGALYGLAGVDRVLADALRILKSIPAVARGDTRRMAFAELFAKAPGGDLSGAFNRCIRLLDSF